MTPEERARLVVAALQPGEESCECASHRHIRGLVEAAIRAAVEEERATLHAALKEALDGWEECAQYKLDFLVEKHGDLRDIARLRALLPADDGGRTGEGGGG